MKLGRYIRSNLDNRYTSYDPEQEMKNLQSLVKLCCPLHGPYEVPLEKLKSKYIRRRMWSAQCKECKSEGFDDHTYRMMVALRLKAYRGCSVNMMLYPPHPEWAPLEHWQVPNIEKHY